uniref:Reverse transcriptase zinc-binding domain-containing protein n=1 Tax=Aegilops tauschii subsp. strangulata TaxID=200361 RepID=A0A453FGM5_AEGTS
MTRDNLRKRHIIKPLDCVFCAEQETNRHLFFDCVVARNIWSFVNIFFQKNLGTNFETVAQFWISNKKNLALNVVSSAVLWCLWKYRNSMIFNNTIWTSINQVWRLIHGMLKFWMALTPEASKSQV